MEEDQEKKRQFSSKIEEIFLFKKESELFKLLYTSPVAADVHLQERYEVTRSTVLVNGTSYQSMTVIDHWE